jgi:hypothetical protein
VNKKRTKDSPRQRVGGNFAHHQRNPHGQARCRHARIRPDRSIGNRSQEAIDLCGGDARAPLHATLIANAFLQSEVERLVATVSTGFARGQVRRRPGKAAVAEKKAG